MRVLVYTGKGGTGKTTVAAATAALAADRGVRTLVVSTDPAHSLADAYDAAIGDDVTELAPCLWARQVEPVSRVEREWGVLREEVAALLEWAGARSLEAEELAVLPGLEEIFSLVDLVDYDESGRYDLVVVDAAPTAETLRLLALPEVTRWWMSYVWPVGRGLAKVVRPVISRVSAMPVASDESLDAAENLFGRLMEAHRILSDPERTSVRLVFNPEKVVLAETRRTYTYLCLFGYSVDAVVANKLIHESGISASQLAECGPAGNLLLSWLGREEEHMARAREDFAALAILESPYVTEEPVGLDRLTELGKRIYGSSDPRDRLTSIDPIVVREEAGGAVLEMYLPLACKENMSVMRRGRELFVCVDGQTRNVHLPHTLARRKMESARYRGRTLSIYFGR